ncbi:MAG: LmeA family phospholipid-binding protein [Mycobacteriaceae bacterium]|nr:LmeA family phospholipid-binding protein [Mycobacteriaceae bacterium]
MLILVIVLALIAAGLIGAELYTRHSANDKIKAATACETQDSADTVSVSFSNSPPVLWQYLTNRFSKITVTTHGTHIRNAQGMTADVVVQDINLHGDATKKGTIGAINASMRWTTDGILQTVKQSINDYIPDSLKSFTQFLSLDSLVTGVTTDPAAGTVTVQGQFGISVTVQPKVENGGLRLVIPQDGIKIPIGSIPRESVQSTLDAKTKSITDNSLNIKVVDPVEIANDAVTLHFAANNSSIPLQSTDNCFANL